MLPKKNRLTKKREFDLVFKKGKTFKNDFLTFKLLKNHFLEGRFGFIVGKNVSKKGTVRNKVKRQLRHALGQEIKNIKSNVAGVFIAQSGIEKKTFFEVKKATIGFLDKANSLK